MGELATALAKFGLAGGCVFVVVSLIVGLFQGFRSHDD